MANNIFSPARFGNYFSLFWANNKKIFILRSLVLLGTLIFMCTIPPYVEDFYILSPKQIANGVSSNVDPFWTFESKFFCFTFFLISIVWASFMFTPMVKKSDRISTLTLPASTLEKFITYFIFYVVAIYVVSIISIYIADYIRILSTHLYYHNNDNIKPIPFDLLIGRSNDIIQYTDNTENVNSLRDFSMALYFGSIILLQSFMAVIGSIWPKNTFSKALGVGFILNALIGMCIYFDVRMFIDTIIAKPEINLSPNSVILLTWCGFYLSAAGLFMLSYFRFKENEVIDRW